ncbi:MAG: NADH-quinone oxidoreductase subunit D [Acidobacteria bacterium]|nr:NADH-quinone oxidoreductase subunit D [Acidobacteriota bacterium]
METREVELNLGPQHPATHGVYRALVKLDGERVLGMESIIGYLHRGIEKWAEYRNWTQATPIFDRLDYVGAVLNCHGYVGAVEKLLGVEVPKKAQYIRVVLDELQRIASHLVWLGTHGLDIGAQSVLFYAIREREAIMDLFEAMLGQRLLPNAYPIGGVRFDFPKGWVEVCRRLLDVLPQRIDEYEGLLTGNRIWRQRTIGVGVISAKDAIALSLSGPTLRGSGVNFDVRKAIPYSSYEDFDFEIPLGQNGDVFDRYLCRVREMRQSLRIIRQALDGMPEGELRGKVSKIIRPPAGEAYFTIEAAKGQLGFYIVSDGGDKPYRVHVKSPSFVNLQGIETMCKGNLIADVVAVIGSLDIVLGEVDR